jgi:NAD-dependent dihydropyrimidine dehydrogenase PreA subunit
VIESIDTEKCTGCELCLIVCPTDVFRLDSEDAVVRIAYPDDCQTCFSCELDCPVDAIRVSPLTRWHVPPW